MVVYHKRFLVWWGLSLFLCKLSSRRQLDYQLNTDGPAVLENLNRLAETAQDSRPVNQTLEYFLEGAWRGALRRPATADGSAVDPHEGPGRGPAAGAVHRLDRRLRVSRLQPPAL